MVTRAMRLVARRCEGGALQAEMMAALFILAVAVIPLAYAHVEDQKELRRAYQRAVAMEIVDGEMEILAAGAWQRWPAGTNAYPVTARAAKNLPAGKFVVIRSAQSVRLEWRADRPAGIGSVEREWRLP